MRRSMHPRDAGKRYTTIFRHGDSVGQASNVAKPHADMGEGAARNSTREDSGQQEMRDLLVPVSKYTSMFGRMGREKSRS